MNKEELVKQISAQIAARVQELKEKGEPVNTDDEIQKLVAAELEAQKAADEQKNLKRMEAGFEENPDGKAMFVNSLSSAKGRVLAPPKMIDKYFNKPQAEAIKEWQDINDDLLLVGTLLAQSRKSSFKAALKSSDLYSRAMHRLKSDEDLRKALYSTGTGVGDEWVPEGFSGQLFEKIRLDLKVAALFQTMNMPTNPYTPPVVSSGATAYLISESTADDATKMRATTPATTNFSFNAVKIGGRAVFSEELDEDSIINILPWIKDEMATALVEGQENSILNGDTSATHQDSNITNAWDAAKAYKGLRYKALNNAGTSSSDFSSAPTTAKMRTLRRLMGKYGVNPNKLAIIVSSNIYLQLVGLTEVSTVDKYGANATILTGELAKIDGIPIIVSEWMHDNLNASGVYDGATTTKSSILMVYRPGFWIGERMGITIDSLRDIQTDQIIVVAKRRLDFKDPYNAELAANIHAVVGYNVTT